MRRMKMRLLILAPLLLLAACKPKDIEPEVRAAVAKAFGGKEELIYLVAAKDEKAGHCGMYGHPATADEPFTRPRPFLYKDGKFEKFDAEGAEKQHFLDQCLGKVPVLVRQEETPALATPK